MVQVSLLDNRIKSVFDMIGHKGFPNVKNMIVRSGEYFQKSWRNNITQSDSPEGWKNPYINKVELKLEKNNTEAIISAERSKFVNFVEDGIESYDMKPGMLASKKVKTSKLGNKYLTIFMRKKVREMPTEVLKQAKQLSFYRMVGIKGNLEKQYNKAMSISAPGTIFHRMVRVGSSKHSRYGTFRIVSSKSKPESWKFPKIPGTKPFDKTVKDKKKEIDENFKKAFKEDINTIYKEMKA